MNANTTQELSLKEQVIAALSCFRVGDKTLSDQQFQALAALNQAVYAHPRTLEDREAEGLARKSAEILEIAREYREGNYVSDEQIGEVMNIIAVQYRDLLTFPPGGSAPGSDRSRLAEAAEIGERYLHELDGGARTVSNAEVKRVMEIVAGRGAELADVDGLLAAAKVLTAESFEQLVLGLAKVAEDVNEDAGDDADPAWRQASLMLESAAVALTERRGN